MAGAQARKVDHALPCHQLGRDDRDSSGSQGFGEESIVRRSARHRGMGGDGDVERMARSTRASMIVRHLSARSPRCIDDQIQASGRREGAKILVPGDQGNASVDA